MVDRSLMQKVGQPDFDFYNLLKLIKLVGKFLHDNLIPTRKLEDTIPSLPTVEREAFLSFVRQMLAWLPEERKTARELMDHPFLNNWFSGKPMGKLQSYAVLVNPGRTLVIVITISIYRPGWIRQGNEFETTGSHTGCCIHTVPLVRWAVKKLNIDIRAKCTSTSCVTFPLLLKISLVSQCWGRIG